MRYADRGNSAYLRNVECRVHRVQATRYEAIGGLYPCWNGLSRLRMPTFCIRGDVLRQGTPRWVEIQNTQVQRGQVPPISQKKQCSKDARA